MAPAFKHEAPETPRVLSAEQLPDRYAMIGAGNCMEPLYMDGACLVFDKHEKPEGGDTVIVWFRHERTPDAEPQCMFKRLVGGLPPISFPFNMSPTSNCEPLVMVEMVNPQRRFRIPASHVLAVHKCIGEADTNGDGTARLRPLNRLSAAPAGQGEASA